MKGQLEYDIWIFNVGENMGLKFTGTAAELYMLLWCVKLSRRLKDVNIVNKMLNK